MTRHDLSLGTNMKAGLHSSHPVAPDDASALEQMELLRRERVEDWTFLLRWTGRSDARLDLLRLLVERRLGVTFTEVFTRLDVSERSGRKFVGELRDAGIVEAEGNPAQIHFADDECYLLATDVAALL